jgi:hypothetical protein
MFQAYTTSAGRLGMSTWPRLTKQWFNKSKALSTGSRKRPAWYGVPTKPSESRRMMEITTSNVSIPRTTLHLARPPISSPLLQERAYSLLQQGNPPRHCIASCTVDNHKRPHWRLLPLTLHPFLLPPKRRETPTVPSLTPSSGGISWAFDGIPEARFPCIGRWLPHDDRRFRAASRWCDSRMRVGNGK